MTELRLRDAMRRRLTAGGADVIRRAWCRLAHRGRGWVDDGPGAVWCVLCGDAR